MEVRAVETFADLLFAFESDESVRGFYNRLAEATCLMADMDRVVIFLYDDGLRRVRAVGSHGIDLAMFADLNVTLDDVPMALRALSEDRVIEIKGEFKGQVPDEYLGLLTDARVVCTPMAAAGRWPGVILSDRVGDRPLSEDEAHRLWTLGKVAALAVGARGATRAQERARELQGRIDLAREIHEGVVQRLFGVSMALSSGAELSQAERLRCAEEIQDALTDLRSAVQRPLGRSSRSTGATLVEEIERLAARHPELNVELVSAADVPPDLEPLAQSVLGEALRNAQKHATPTRVEVDVRRDDNTFVLEVENDGVGNAHRRSGIGLRLAAFEALQHGATIEFGPAGEDRWRVRLLAPTNPGRR